MRIFRFYKQDGDWKLDLRHFPFHESYLDMVAGSDELLDKLAEGEDELRLAVDSYPIPYSDGWLEKDKSHKLGGAIYNAQGIELEKGFQKKSQLWLSAVVLLGFLGYPKKIYYKVDRTKAEDTVVIWGRHEIDRALSPI